MGTYKEAILNGEGLIRFNTTTMPPLETFLLEGSQVLVLHNDYVYPRTIDGEREVYKIVAWLDGVKDSVKSALQDLGVYEKLAFKPWGNYAFLVDEENELYLAHISGMYTFGDTLPQTPPFII